LNNLSTRLYRIDYQIDQCTVWAANRPQEIEK
jgi:hypothetical protein